MDILQHERAMACAAFTDVVQLERAYRELVRAGISPADLSVLISEETQTEEGERRNGRSVLQRLAPIHGGYSGGIRVRALGPARSFGVTGSVASGLIRTGIPDDEAAWLMNALVDGRGLVLVHGRESSTGVLAAYVFGQMEAERYRPAKSSVAEPPRASAGA